MKFVIGTLDVKAEVEAPSKDEAFSKFVKDNPDEVNKAMYLIYEVEDKG